MNTLPSYIQEMGLEVDTLANTVAVVTEFDILLDLSYEKASRIEAEKEVIQAKAKAYQAKKDRGLTYSPFKNLQ
jgi:hypothetical protein